MEARKVRASKERMHERKVQWNPDDMKVEMGNTDGDNYKGSNR